ncbi:MAG: hypothetical protein ABI222_01135 [Opitutaceae bacterium]
MNTFWKILLCVMTALLCLHFLPVLLILIVLGFVALLALGAVLASGLGGIVAVALVLLTVLAPIWIPVLAMVGIVSLCRRNNRTAAA